MSSEVSCDKKCSGAAKNVELGGDGFNFYVVSFSVKKGKGKIQKATVELGTKDISIFNISKTCPPAGFGTEGPFPPFPGSTTMPGSGSGMPGTIPPLPPTMPPMPPGGSGSGMPPMPPGGSGYGGGCASGFLKVCPEMYGQCPYYSTPVCPESMPMPMVRTLDRMGSDDNFGSFVSGSDDGCECVPMVSRFQSKLVLNSIFSGPDADGNDPAGSDGAVPEQSRRQHL